MKSQEIEITQADEFEFVFRDKDGREVKNTLTAKRIMELVVDDAFENIDQPDCTSSGCNNESQNFCDCGGDYDDYVFNRMSLMRSQSEPSKWISEIDKARFWMKAEITPYCWNWTGSLNSDGYGVTRIGMKVLPAHRVAYELINGEIFDSLEICHKCDNPKCINPDHLFSGTHLENMQDMKLKNRGRKFIGKTSKWHGVGWRIDTKSWRTWVRINGKTKTLGMFKDENDAVQFRDNYILENKIPNNTLNLTPPTK